MIDWIAKRLGYVSKVEVEERMKVIRQAFLEVNHAQRRGPSWYTRGEDGLYQQVDMWVRRGFEAAEKPALEDAS